MNNSYPDDADGDALRAVEESGANMLRPMSVEFSISAPDIESARSIAEIVSEHGFSPDIYIDDEDHSVSVYCARAMLATYSCVVSAQNELNGLCEPFGGECDGWITAGNMQGE